MPYSRLPSSRPQRRRLVPVIAGAVFALILVACALYATDHLPFWNRHKPVSSPTSKTSDTSTKGESSDNTSGQSGDQNSNGSTKNDGTSASGPLLIPSGTFVSSHHISLSNNPSGSGYVTSTCTTTPGATCQITFTKDGVVKSLPAETTDAGGSAYWNNWQPGDYGLSSGSWTITAVAKSGDQTKTATDALTLEVGQ